MIDTHCPYCSLQCGVRIDTSVAPPALTAQEDFPTNLGGLCAKGWTAAECDTDYIAARTTGFEAVRRAVRLCWPDRVERLTGVPEGDIVQATRVLAGAERGIILTARGAEQHRSGSDTAVAFINLALALGLPGRPFSGYGTVTGQGNGQGGREHGQKADQLPGYRRLDDPAAGARGRGVGHRPRRVTPTGSVGLRDA